MALHLENINKILTTVLERSLENYIGGAWGKAQILTLGSDVVRFLFAYRISSLTHSRLASLFWGLGKQCRPSSDATERGV